MTLAEKCHKLWYDRPHDRTYSVLKLARKFVDLKVKHKRVINWERNIYEDRIEYRFRDGSLLYTSGRGPNHKVWLP